MFARNEGASLIFAATIVGLITGYTAVAFIWLIEESEHVAFEVIYPYLYTVTHLGHWTIILIPALGSLISGPLIYFFAQEAKGHGVPEVMMAIALQGGKMRPIVAVIKALASSVCIGSGGSAGREGPIVQIGSVMGSLLGQLFKMTTEKIQTLVACGAGAGIAAVFNAPIAGSMFAVEIIAGEYSAFSFGSVLVASVTASIVARHYLGASPAFSVPKYSMKSPQELIFFAVLGVLAAFMAYLFVVVLYASEDIFDNWKLHPAFKPAVGGLMLGAIGFLAPYTLGTGLPWIERALEGGLWWKLMIAAAFIKIIGTSLTLGSGNSGGIFSPSLFMGAMLGGAFGMWVNTNWPAISAPYQAYALVGMAAVFAGAARAPVTAILMVFEMSDDYRMILPLMFATAASVLVSEYLSKDSIYTLKLTRRGIYLERGHEIDVMQGVTVGEVMSRNMDVVDPSMPLTELDEMFKRTFHHGFPVVDKQGRFVGIVTLHDLMKAREKGIFERHTVAEIMNRNPIVTYPEEPVWRALRIMGERDVGRLPVVDRNDPTRLLGMLRRGDIIKAYQRGIQKRLDAHTSVDRVRLAHLTGMEIMEFTIHPGAPLAGKAIKDARLPEGALLVTLRRGGNVAIIHGDVILQPGDKVTVLAKKSSADKVRQLFMPKPEEEVVHRRAPFE